MGEVYSSRELSPQIGFALEFAETGDFRALNAATEWLVARGYSVGRLQRGAPCGILLGEYDIQKWRNLSNSERRDLDGQLSGNFRDGPVVIRLAATPSSAEQVARDSSRDTQNPPPTLLARGV